MGAVGSGLEAKALSLEDLPYSHHTGCVIHDRSSYSPARCFAPGSLGSLVVAPRAALDAEDPMCASLTARHEGDDCDVRPQTCFVPNGDPRLQQWTTIHPYYR